MMNRSMFSRLLYWKQKPSTKPRKRRPDYTPMQAALVSLEPRVMLSAAAPLADLQVPLAPTTQALSSLMTGLTDSTNGALAQIVNVVNTAEASVNDTNPAGDVATARAALTTVLTTLHSELNSAQQQIGSAGAQLPNAVNGILHQTAEGLSIVIQRFATSLAGVNDAVQVATLELPDLTVSTLTGGEIAGLNGDSPPFAVNSLGQQLENLLGNLAENTSTLLASLGQLDGAAVPVGTISGTVTNTSGGAPIANIPIELINANGVVVQSAVTDNLGRYSLTVEQNGAYAVREVTPSGYIQMSPTFTSTAPLAQSGTPPAGSFGYFGSTTILPANWDAEAPFGGDPDQSPINITGPTTNLQSPALLSNLGQFTANTTVAGNTVSVTNTGFQLKVAIPQGKVSDPAPTIVLDGTTYTLQQFHYHDTSENTVDGQSYPMEEHLVFTSATGAELVVGAFVQVGTANSSFQTILDAAANLGTTPNSSQPIAGGINISDLLPSQTQGWYYQGSLTTPPLSAPVNWMVLSTPITISAAQLHQYETSAGDLGFLPNARPVQPLDGRQLNEIDNYVNFQGGQAFSVTGQAISNVNFTLSGSAVIPVVGTVYSSNAALYLTTSVVDVASTLNNLQSSANAVEGLLSPITIAQDWNENLLQSVKVAVNEIENGITGDLKSLNGLVSEVNNLAPGNAQLLLDGAVAEVASMAENTSASLAGIIPELPQTGSSQLVADAESLSSQLETYSTALSNLAVGLDSVFSQLPGLKSKDVNSIVNSIEDLIGAAVS